jgi:patatin-like phospholipase/acyl hydrolase
MDARPTFTVLALDGGGIRGLITAIWLEALETRVGRPLAEVFDLIAGTSTGAILAAALATGRSPGEAADLYVQEADRIFPGRLERLWDRARRLFPAGLSAPRYTGEGLDRVLKREFGEKRLGRLPVRTLVTAYDAWGREPVIFKSWRREHANVALWEAVRASCAAPGYFPAHVMTLKRRKRPLLDGGVFANNPSACALAEAWRLLQADGRDPRGIVLASFGTGEATRPISVEQATEWGPLEWATPIIDVLFDGAADSVDYIVGQLLGQRGYFRAQVPLAAAYDDLDNVDRTNLAALRATAEEWLAGPGEALLDELATRLR